MWKYMSDLLRKARRDEKGATALIFGLTLIPVVLGIGLAIDYGRALTTKQRLGQAIDSAGLAAASWPGLSDAELEAKAMDYVNANFVQDGNGTLDSITINKSEHTLTIEASAHVLTTFMNIAGIKEVEVGAYAEVSIKEKKIELVMALDNTGSMGQSGKIGALRDAATTLVNILKPDDGDTNSDEVKVGLVPFAAAVNIGADNLNSGWIDTGAQSSIASEDFSAGVNVLDLYNQINNRSWNGCVRARPAPYDTTDAPPTGGDTLWVPYFAPDEPDTGSNYSNRYASDGISGNKNKRQRYTGKYAGLTVSSTSRGPDYNCRTPEVTPLTQIKSTIMTGVNAMVATGNTVIPAGLSWGWRLISPTEPFSEGAEYDDDDVVKAIILLTDGENNVSGGTDNHNRSRYSAYGFAKSGHMGSTNGSQAESVLDDKTEVLCNNIKAEGVRVYTVTFQLSDGPTKDLMRNCASDTSMYYDSPSNSQLEAVFEDIAKGLNDLRLSK